MYRRLRIPVALLLPLLLLGSKILAQAPPSTDIWLFTVVEGDSDAISIAVPERVTDRPFYDNQPAFFPGGFLAFTSMGEAGKTDILAYDLEKKTTRVLISTPESEYSPTPVPGRAAASIIRDYGNENQQLWSIPIGDTPADGAEGENLLPDINPVGYHAWIDDKHVLLFVLGDPPTLRFAHVGPAERQTLARNPGRALAKVPSGNRMSFVHKLFEGQWFITLVDPETGDLRRLFRTLPEREDFAWSPSGWVFMADGTKLYRRKPTVLDWQEVADLSQYGLGAISRIAFDESGSRLALVSERLPSP